MLPLPSPNSVLRHCLAKSAVTAVHLRKWTTNTLQPRKTQTRTGISIVGFFETASGLGVTARAVSLALADYAPRCFSISRLAHTPQATRAHFVTATAPQPIAVPSRLAIHVYNPDVFIRLIRQYGTRLLADNDTNIALPVWETETPPSFWSDVLAAYNYIWSPSQYSAESLRRATGRLIRVVPTYLPEKPIRVRARTDSTYVFMVIFDHHSCLHRKNPCGAIRAFRSAAEILRPHVTMRLRVKCHADTPRSLIDILRAHAGDAPVEFVTATLDECEMDSLWQDCDCLLSLHRSEGFGLLVAEALSRAIPVIATRQGGILDFTDDNGCMLVDGRAPISVAQDSDYSEWSGWIEPDLEQASAFIVRLLTNYKHECSRATIGRERVRKTLDAHSIRAALDSLA